MMTTSSLARQLVDLERTVRELRTHIRILETRLGTIRGEDARMQSWWRLLLRRGGGSGRSGKRSSQIRENRRVNHEHYAQQRLHCA